MMKRIKVVGILAAMVIMLSGCSTSGIDNAIDKFSRKHTTFTNVNGVDYNKAYADEFYENTVNLFFDYVENKDNDGIKNLLCKSMQNESNIDSNIDDLINGFEGPIVEITKHNDNTISTSRAAKESTVFLSKGFYVKTDKETYVVYIEICPENPQEDEIGINSISIYTLDRFVAKENNDGNSDDSVDETYRFYIDYGDSSEYFIFGNGSYSSISVFKLINSDGAISREDISNYSDRNFSTFTDKFGEAYGEDINNDSGYTHPQYIYKLSGEASNSCVLVKINEETGLIGSIAITHIDSNEESEEIMPYQ